MVIIHGGKIINPVSFPLNEIESVVIRRIEKWEHTPFHKVRTDDLELVFYTKIKPKSRAGHIYKLYPGDVIQINDVKITVPDLTGLEEDRKEFVMKTISENLNLCVMLEQNSI